MFKKNRIQVIIACKQLLISIGIQALINHLGIEPEYHEIKSFKVLSFDKNTKNDYLIIHHKLLEYPQANHLNQILYRFKGKVLVIGDEKMDPNFHSNILLPTDTETDIIEKLQNFFSTIKEQTEDNPIISAREIDILKEVAQGYSNKEIADRLFISINTVITHRKNLTEKLGIKTISGLTVYALMNNLIKPEDVTT